MLSEALAQYIVEMEYERLPGEVVAFTKLCILDWYGSALAGKDQPPVQMIREMIEEMGGNPQATLVTGGKTSVAQAALVNGSASHIVELDDIHKSSIIHAATVVVPAALAVAEWKQLSGKAFITAVAIGYEVCYRIGEAVTPSHYYYWHNTATCGTFGAAAAVAKLLRLNEEQIIHTLGNAGTQAAGLWEFIEDGAMSKQLHPAKAAYNGVISAVLAEKGFTAARKILEGDRGFFQAMSEEPDAGKVTDQLGKTFKIMENSFKIHASCRHTHAVVDLVLDYIREGVKADDLKEIRIQTYKIALDITDNPAPNTVYAAKFSIQYCAALAFTLGSASLSDFNEDHLFHPDVRHLMEKVHVSVSDKMEAAYPKDWGAIVEILLADGRRRSKETRGPKGDPETPVSAGELKQKFSRLALPVLGKQTEAAIERILNLENDRVVSFM